MNGKRCKQRPGNKMSAVGNIDEIHNLLLMSGLCRYLKH